MKNKKLTLKSMSQYKFARAIVKNDYDFWDKYELSPELSIKVLALSAISGAELTDRAMTPKELGAISLN